MAEGTGEFKAKTSNIDTEVNGQIDEVLSKLSGDGSAPVSFVSSENANVQSVQFVIKTGAIEVPEATVPDQETVKSLNFWQKLLRLFGLY